MKNFTIRIINFYRISQVFWRDNIVAIMTNNQKRGLTLLTFFKMVDQKHADILAEKLEYFAREIRQGKFNSKP